MNPVNAAALYVSASRAVLQCDPRQPHTFSDMYTLLPFFRQSLACLVCGELVRDPVSAPHPGCTHHVCLGCRGRKTTAGRAACSRCRDAAGFREDKQLSLLVQLYRKLCVYVAHSALLPCVSANAELMALLEEALLAPVEDAESPDTQGSCTSMERTVDGDLVDSEPVEDSELLVGEAAEDGELVGNDLLDNELVDGGLVDGDPVEDGELELEASAAESSTHTKKLQVPAELYPEPGGCNGALLENLEPSSPELEVCELMEETLPQPQPEGLPVSDTATLELSLTTGPFTAGAFAPGAYPTGAFPAGAFAPAPGGRELEEGEVLLLSVEEVLQTLDPLQPPTVGPPDRHAHMYLQLDAAHNYTQLHTERTHMAVTPVFPPPTLPPPLPTSPSSTSSSRHKRKRSRSESDREQVRPLPIASILQGPTSPHAQHAAAPSFVAPPHAYSSLYNGAPPKPARHHHHHHHHHHGKGARKHGELAAKKKARSGGKSKERSKEQRLQVSGCLVPPPPARPPYKKPVEKKGCKCGRATQNPSVLTCRGQRCPCYSNRKACLDCICRGCQNSYMANGEKKLEAFAVPEKALEQTRLTLGINLTSITAAAALRSPAGSGLRAGTLLNVATATGAPVATAFLSASSPPRDPAYEDSLELLIG
ncbi:E3 ubiquitin-protein ligase MSL2a isoform X1 [Phyllopteryx taeniolatus]|uniref:E3 ubiquitin-protein ligase MSL2a isoform X1 n=1 Tax=Phyllopteryx taeniolatus TaxID=161469 RepID=UPI002AD4228B|nr:E3 ubiquitin-protein ligase MSL2a isoform X1 [Phyllopteryx taeniolatus]